MQHSASIKPAIQVGNRVIREKAEIVKDISHSRIQKTVKNLIDSMHHHNLVGMAAPQIGEGIRVFVSEIRTTTLRKTKEKDAVRVFVNPRIVKKSKSEINGYEGCGSVAHAHLFGLVKRAKSVTVTALDEKGNPFVVNVSGLLARIIQHEIDHLDGVIFLDRVADLRSLMERGEYLKILKKRP